MYGKLDANGDLYTSTISHGIQTPFAVPAATTNGTALGTPPVGYIGAAFMLPVAATLAFSMAITAPGAAPVSIPTITNNSGSVMWIDVNIISPWNFYITVMTGAVYAAWYV